MLEIRNTIQKKNDFFKLGDSVRVKYNFNETGIEGWYYGKVTLLLLEFDTFNGHSRPMIQLNNDEFHTYYCDKCEKVTEDNNPYKE